MKYPRRDNAPFRWGSYCPKCENKLVMEFPKVEVVRGNMMCTVCIVVFTIFQEIEIALYGGNPDDKN